MFDLQNLFLLRFPVGQLRFVVIVGKCISIVSARLNLRKHQADRRQWEKQQLFHEVPNLYDNRCFAALLCALEFRSYWPWSLVVFALSASVLFLLCANRLSLNVDEGAYLDGGLRGMNGQQPYRD